ncbi:hypothetical protein ACFL35_20505 [Candidatus Riflebacteria bacterium]
MPHKNTVSINQKKKVAAAIACGFFFILALLLFYYLVFIPNFCFFSTNNAVKIPCQIIESSVVKSNRQYKFNVEFAYDYNGVTYKSFNFKYANHLFNKSENAKKLLKKFPQGKMTYCYVDSFYPAEAVLLKELTFSEWFSVYILYLVLVFISLGISIYSRLKFFGHFPGIKQE